MAQLKWDFINPVNYGAANQLYQQGNEQISKAIQGAGQAVTGYGEGIKKQQTDEILNALYQAQNPDQLSGAMANVNALQQQFGRGYDQAAVRKEVDARGQTLNQQALGQIQLTQAQNQQAAFPVMNEAAIAAGKARGLDVSGLEKLGALGVDATGQINNAITGLTQDRDYKTGKEQWEKTYNRGVVVSDRDYNLSLEANNRANISTGADVAKNFVTPAVTGMRVNPQTGEFESFTSGGTSFGGAFGSVMGNLFKAESGNNHYQKDGSLTRSPKGALGVAQIMPATAAKPGYGMQPIDLRNTTPEQQKAWANEYINKIAEHHNFTLEQGVAAYNAGPGAVEKAIKAGGANWLSKLPKETQNYVPKVMGGASAGQQGGGGGTTGGGNTSGAAAPGVGYISQADFANLKGSYATKKAELDSKYSGAESKSAITSSIIGGGPTVEQWKAKQEDGVIGGLLRGDSQNIYDAAKGNLNFTKLPEELKVKVLDDTSAWLSNKEGWLGSNGSTKELKARINNTIRQYTQAKASDYNTQKTAIFDTEYQGIVTKFTAAGSAAPSRQAAMKMLDPELYDQVYGKKEAKAAVDKVANEAKKTPEVDPAKAKAAQAKQQVARIARIKADEAVAKARALDTKLAQERKEKAAEVAKVKAKDNAKKQEEARVIAAKKAKQKALAASQVKPASMTKAMEAYGKTHTNLNQKEINELFKKLPKS